MPDPAANDGFGFLHESRRAIFFGGERFWGGKGETKMLVEIDRDSSLFWVVRSPVISAYVELKAIATTSYLVHTYPHPLIYPLTR